MKTSIKSLVFAISLSAIATTASFAETKPVTHASAVSYQESVYQTKDGKLAIALNKELGGAVDIQLKSTAGEVLYVHHIAKNESQSRLRLNLSELPDGVYHVEITNGSEIKTHTITLGTQQPEAPSRVITMN